MHVVGAKKEGIPLGVMEEQSVSMRRKLIPLEISLLFKPSLSTRIHRDSFFL
jgi:hypothetical protein